MKIKGYHDQDLQNEKVESNVLKLEINKLKAQVDKETNKKISKKICYRRCLGS